MLYFRFPPFFSALAVYGREVWDYHLPLVAVVGLIAFVAGCLSH